QVVVQADALRHVSQPGPDLLRAAGHIAAQHPRLAIRRAQQPQQHADGRRLAGAVRPEKAEDLPAPHAEADVIDRAAAAEVPRETLDLDGVVAIAVAAVERARPLSHGAPPPVAGSAK